MNSYMGSAVVGLNVRDGRSAGFATEVKTILTNVSAHATRAGWPSSFRPVGMSRRATQLMVRWRSDRRLQRHALSSTKVGRTSVFTSVLNVTSDYTARLLGKNSSIDYIIINEHSAEAPGY